MKSRKPCLISRALVLGVEAAPRLVLIAVTWDRDAPVAMPALIMHPLVPGLPTHGAN